MVARGERTKAGRALRRMPATKVAARIPDVVAAGQDAGRAAWLARGRLIARRAAHAQTAGSPPASRP